MSYCRFSSDNWRSEVYCYADVSGGFTTHVAGNKVVGDVPDDGIDDMVSGHITPEECAKRHRVTMEYLNTAERRPLGLPCDGQSFNDPDLESFLARLLNLKGMGYRVPDHVIEDVRAEVNDAATAAREQGNG